MDNVSYYMFSIIGHTGVMLMNQNEINIDPVVQYRLSDVTSSSLTQDEYNTKLQRSYDLWQSIPDLNHKTKNDYLLQQQVLKDYIKSIIPLVIPDTLNQLLIEEILKYNVLKYGRWKYKYKNVNGYCQKPVEYTENVKCTEVGIVLDCQTDYESAIWHLIWSDNYIGVSFENNTRWKNYKITEPKDKSKLHYDIGINSYTDKSIEYATNKSKSTDGSRLSVELSEMVGNVESSNNVIESSNKSLNKSSDESTEYNDYRPKVLIMSTDDTYFIALGVDIGSLDLLITTAYKDIDALSIYRLHYASIKYVFIDQSVGTKEELFDLVDSMRAIQYENSYDYFKIILVAEDFIETIDQQEYYNHKIDVCMLKSMDVTQVFNQMDSHSGKEFLMIENVSDDDSDMEEASSNLCRRQTITVINQD